MSIQSNTLSTGSIMQTSRNLREKLNEVQTYRDILFDQVETLQRYFDACASGAVNQNLESEHNLRVDDFKGEAITFRETTLGVLTTLNHCLEIIVQKEDGMKRKLEREIEKRRNAEEELK